MNFNKISEKMKSMMILKVNKKLLHPSNTSPTVILGLNTAQKITSLKYAPRHKMNTLP